MYPFCKQFSSFFFLLLFLPVAVYSVGQAFASIANTHTPARTRLTPSARFRFTLPPSPCTGDREGEGEEVPLPFLSSCSKRPDRIWAVFTTGDATLYGGKQALARHTLYRTLPSKFAPNAAK
jgi:hypothetical protein